ncbi:hypothetical protein BGZ73_005476 [Actinomortierella ambigua]|nr:hypothetical protein BGZ73_005476 [Actinomortierella ambigua]
MANLQPLATQLSTLSRIELYMQVKTPVDGAIHFVQAHREAFPDMLDEIKLDVTTSMSYHGSSALVRLLQAMERPRVIDVRGWPGAVQNLAQFPSAGCRVLLTRQGIMANLVTAVPPPPQPHDFAMESSGGDGSLTTAAEVPPSLSEIVSTFPKLESIRMTVNTPDFFAWAGQSRRGANSRATAMTATTITPGQPTRFLRHVRLDGFDRDLIPSLIDVARYYEQTLESLIALSRFDMRLPQYLKKTAPVDKKKKAATKASIIADTDSDAGANAATTAFGSAAVTDADRLVWTWTLPRLHTLDLEGSIAIRFDYTSLQYCPGLTDLRLNVGRRIPEDWDPQLDALVYIVQLPRLRVLDLAGYWGLTDKMIAQVLVPGLADRLHRLNLMWCRGPTQAGIEAVVRGIRALKWLGLSGETGLERDTIVSMRKVLQLESLELDISVAL